MNMVKKNEHTFSLFGFSLAPGSHSFFGGNGR